MALPAVVVPPPSKATATQKPVARRAPAAGGGYAAEAARSAERMPVQERAARAFLRMAAVSARVEADASRLAISRAQDEKVRAYAAQLARYHAEADLELLRLLHERAMAAPMLESAQRKSLTRLGKLEGGKFDRGFLELVSVQRQRAEVQQFQRAAQTISDPVLKAWIERQLPAMREQQAAAQRLAGGKPAAVAQADRLRLTRTSASSIPSRASVRPAHGRS
jgi:putative membrane protein